MPALDNFTQFYGRHWTTGSIAAALDYMGAKNPLTGSPFTEAFLLGVCGGAAFGYFTFDYKGFDPQVNILTRNTFNNYGWDAITARLGLAQDVVHSTAADKAQKSSSKRWRRGGHQSCGPTPTHSVTRGPTSATICG